MLTTPCYLSDNIQVFHFQIDKVVLNCLEIIAKHAHNFTALAFSDKVYLSIYNKNLIIYLFDMEAYVIHKLLLQKVINHTQSKLKKIKIVVNRNEN